MPGGRRQKTSPVVVGAPFAPSPLALGLLEVFVVVVQHVRVNGEIMAAVWVQVGRVDVLDHSVLAARASAASAASRVRSLHAP